MAKSPRGGVPVTESRIGASAVWVVSSTGVTAVGHATYPTGPGGASEESRAGATLGWAKSEQPDSAAAASTRAGTNRRGHTRALLGGGVAAITGDDPTGTDSPRSLGASLSSGEGSRRFSDARSSGRRRLRRPSRRRSTTTPPHPVRTTGSVDGRSARSGRWRAGEFEETGHPLIQSFEPGEEWWWCY